MNSKLYLYIGLLVGLLLIVIVGYIVYNSLTFRLVETQPGGQTIPSSTVKLIFKFNKDIQNSTEELKNNVHSDQSIINSVSKDKDKIIINLKTLNVDTKYQIIFDSIKSTDGKSINFLKYDFSTTYVAYNDLTHDQQKQQIEPVDKGLNEDPITKVTPHINKNYTITIRWPENGGRPIIKITLLPEYADYNTDINAALKKYKSQALEYLRVAGIDASKYQIEYEPTQAKDL